MILPLPLAAPQRSKGKNQRREQEMTLEGKWRPHRSRVRRLADPWGASSTAPGLARAERPAAAPRLRLTPPPAQGSRSPLEKRMLLAALRSAKDNHAGGQGWIREPGLRGAEGRVLPS